jgi:hypothetical protein
MACFRMICSNERTNFKRIGLRQTSNRFEDGLGRQYETVGFLAA